MMMVSPVTRRVNYIIDIYVFITITGLTHLFHDLVTEGIKFIKISETATKLDAHF